jgi:AAA family ATP:ADP antiporter
MTLLQSLTTVRFPAAAPRTRLERFLAHLADVRAGEGVGALVLALNLFLLLGAYYMLKTAREALILSEGGAEVKSYSAAGQAILLLAVVPLFGAFASRVNRVNLVSGVMLFFASNLAVFIVLGRLGFHEGVPFFLWVGVFNVMVIAQLWAFANDLYTRREGERLFPLLGLGSSLGAWLGAVAAARVIRAAGPYGLMTAAAVLLIGCVALTRWIDRRHVRTEGAGARENAEKPLGKEGAFQLIFHDPYLMLIAALVVLLNIVNTSGEFLLSKLVVAQAARAFPDAIAMAADRQRFIGEFYGSFFAWVNIAGLVLQTFFVSRIFKAIGPARALFIGPTIALVGYSVILVAPLLGLVQVLKVLDNSVDYSIQNTARQALFLPTSREAKYKAKAAIDAFFMRFGDVLQAGVVYVGTALGFVLSSFAALNLAFTMVWLFVAAALTREYAKRSSGSATLPDSRSAAAGALVYTTNEVGAGSESGGRRA